MPKLYKALWGLKRYEKLLKVPRQYANRLEATAVDEDAALVMARSAARSPENVRALMKAHGVNSVVELLKHLPDQRYKARPLRRILARLRAINGELAHNPDVSRYNKLAAKGLFSRPDLHARIDRIKEFRREDLAD